LFSLGCCKIRRIKQLIKKDKDNPCDEKDIIKDTCDLLNENDVDYIFDKFIRLELINKNSTFDEITEIHNFIKSRKSVPIRYMITVFHLIYFSNRPIKGYFPLIQKEQTATEDVVRSLWPVDRIGTETISIVYYLPKPSWNFLGKIIES
jgi:hypothetical protein